MCKITFSYYDRVCSYYRELLKLLYSLRQKIGTSSLSLSQILDSEEGYIVLDENSFLSIARENGIAEAYSRCEKHFPVEKEDKLILRRYFSQFGFEMLSAELENLNIVIESFEKKFDKIKSDNPSKKRISSTMIVCCTLMLIILIV